MTEPRLSVVDLLEHKLVIVRPCIEPQGTGTFLQISGAKSKHIALLGNDFSGAKNAIEKDGNIEAYMNFNRIK